MTELNIISETINQYDRPLFGFIKSKINVQEEAEDILQDVWYQLSNVENIDEIDNIGSWLYRVTRNKITDFFRKKKTKPLEDFAIENEDGIFEIPDFLLKDTSNPNDIIFNEMFWDELNIALNELPENQRDVFISNEIDGKTLQQIADEKNENLKTIISRKGYAVKHLKKKLSYLYEDFYL